MDEIAKKELDELMKSNKNLRKCPCGAIMEVQQGEVNLKVTDENGNEISPAAAIHMSIYRVRCSECQNNFCSECRSQPYHLGKNCDEYARHKAVLKCIYCDSEIAAGANHPKREDVCKAAECSKLVEVACPKKKACGHRCGGFLGEEKCLPCLQENCVKVNDGEERKDGVFEGVNADAYCGICFISGLGAEPAIQIGCGHVFHFNCVKNLLEKKWVTPRITFNFLKCPTCKQPIDCKHSAALTQLFDQAVEIKTSVEKKALERAKFEELHKNPRLSDPKDFYFNKLGDFALYKMAYYQCHKCKVPYFGGMIDCGDAQNALQDFKPEELVCPKCSAESVGAGVKNCGIHGAENIDFKCRFCCSVALWFCHGNTHYCDPCHMRAGRNDKKACPGNCKKEGCPLKVDHPPSGEEFALGCGLCRSKLINAKEF